MEYKHFSHEHTLTLYRLQPGQTFQCHGCQLTCNNSVYVCWACNFFLHEHCGNANRYVKHPCHSLHPLVLIPSPTYCSGTFLCNACGGPGNKFSYCCTLCEVDLHMHCTYLPKIVTDNVHEHDLYLDFSTPDENGRPSFCKICTKEMSSKNWSYCCAKMECGIRVHTFCVTSEVKPGQYGDDETDAQIPVQNPAANPDVCASQPDLTPLDAYNELMQLQMQMQMQQQVAQMMSSIISGARI